MLCMVYLQVKVKGQRKIGFSQFLTALDQIAAKKGTSFEDIVRVLIESGGPVDNGTKAENVRLHDDKVKPGSTEAQHDHMVYCATD